MTEQMEKRYYSQHIPSSCLSPVLCEHLSSLSQGLPRTAGESTSSQLDTTHVSFAEIHLSEIWNGDRHDWTDEKDAIVMTYLLLAYHLSSGNIYRPRTATESTPSQLNATLAASNDQQFPVQMGLTPFAAISPSGEIIMTFPVVRANPISFNMQMPLAVKSKTTFATK